MKNIFKKLFILLFIVTLFLVCDKYTPTTVLVGESVTIVEYKEVSAGGLLVYNNSSIQLSDLPLIQVYMSSDGGVSWTYCTQWYIEEGSLSLGGIAGTEYWIRLAY